MMEFFLAFISALLVMILIAGAFIGGYFYGRKKKPAKPVEREIVQEADALRKKHIQNLFRF